jgi:hypothetical protein
MLMHVIWEFVDNSEEGTARSLAVFQGWKPPQGADFKGFYGFADADGGVAIIEVDSAATLPSTPSRSRPPSAARPSPSAPGSASALHHTGRTHDREAEHRLSA